jgi:hypothetical protein
MIKEAELKVNRDAVRQNYSKEYEDVPVWNRLSDQPIMIKENQDNSKKPVAAYMEKHGGEPVRSFESMMGAKRWLEETQDRELRKSNLSTALRLGIRCGGYY